MTDDQQRFQQLERKQEFHSRDIALLQKCVLTLTFVLFLFSIVLLWVCG